MPPSRKEMEMGELVFNLRYERKRERDYVLASPCIFSFVLSLGLAIEAFRSMDLDRNKIRRKVQPVALLPTEQLEGFRNSLL
mgnify:CR=1 FL=1